MLIWFHQRICAVEIRFIDKPKHVNRRHAIKLIAEVPAIGVEARSVFCNGGDGALGHPKVNIYIFPFKQLKSSSIGTSK